MIHHRRVAAAAAGSGQPHQPTATGAVSSSSSGFVGRSTTTGNEQGGVISSKREATYTTKTTGDSPAAPPAVEELRGNKPTAVVDGGRRRELPWRKRRRLLLLWKVALVAVAGAFALLLLLLLLAGGKRLTTHTFLDSSSSSSAGRRSTPFFSRLDHEPSFEDTKSNNRPRSRYSSGAGAGAGAGDAAAVDWTEAVAGCTGAEDGFVYGGKNGDVLTFVHRGRGGGGGGRGRGGGGGGGGGEGEGEGGSDHGYSDHNGGGGGGGSGADLDRPALPDVLKWFWGLKRDRGVLAFEVAELEERRDVGSETGWEVVFSSNVGRHKPFPAAGPAEVTWDPSSFNFYKGSPSEFLLSYTPSFRHERESAAAAAAGATGATGAAVAAGEGRAVGNGIVEAPMEIDAAPEEEAAAAAAAAIGEAKAAPVVVALRGAHGGEINSPAEAVEMTGLGLGGVSSAGCREASTALPPQDAVLVNIRPVGPVSLLLTPGYPHSHNQRAAAESLAVAMDFAEALRMDPGFRLGFNSAGSSASVNHLHFQCWYFDAGPGGLAIEASKTVHAATVPLRPSGARGGDAVEVHTLIGYPIRTLVFHTLGKDLEAVGEVIEKCVNLLVEENTPHTVVFSTGRAFLLPRRHLEEPPFAVVPGFPEVSGEVIVTKEEDFRTITADQVFDWWRDKIGVSAEHFDRITDGCLK